MLTSETIVHILIQSLIIILFNTWLYFVFTTRLEERIIQNQSEKIIHDLTKDIKLMLPSESREKLREIIDKNLTYPDLSKEDEEVRENNRKLMRKTIQVLSILSVLVLACVVIIYYVSPFDVVKVLKENLVLLTFVALVEVVFLLVIVKNFISVDANFVKFTILNSLAKV